MIQNRRAYQLIHCRTRSRLLAGAAAVCGAACGHADLGLYHLLHRGGAPLPDSTQADRAALAALCPKPATEETCPLLPPQDPTVTLSVIVPVYNGEATIGPCLDSILQQETSCTVQLIVVDSDSTDGTAAVLERYRALPGVLLCNCSAPRSAAAARNEGLRHAVGRWLMFVDSDDLLLPGAIRTLLEAAQRLDADVVQGGWQYLYTDGTRGPVQRYPAAVYTGTGRLEQAVRAQAQELGITDHILFAGLQNNVADWYQMMDLFVMPSRFEGLPVVGIEAQAAGLGCVFSDAVPAEVLLSSHAIQIPLSASNADWAAGLQRMLHQPCDRSAGAELIRQAGYDINIAAARLQQQYLQLGGQA